MPAGATASKVSGPLGGSKLRSIRAIGAMLPRMSIRDGIGEVRATRRSTGPDVRVTRRTAVPRAAADTCACAHWTPKLGSAPVAGAASSRARNGASTNSPTSSESCATCRRCRLSATAKPSPARPYSRRAAARSAAWSQAAATSVSWWRCTTAVPSAAATRAPGSRFSCSYQRPPPASRPTSGRYVAPYRGGASSGSPGRASSGAFSTRRSSAANGAIFDGSDQRWAGESRASRAPPSSSCRSSTPVSGRPEVDRSIARVPNSSGTPRPRIASASDWKSPAGPVAKRQWWYTGSSTLGMPGFSVQAGPDAEPGSRPSPVRRPASKVGTTQAR